MEIPHALSAWENQSLNELLVSDVVLTASGKTNLALTNMMDKTKYKFRHRGELSTGQAKEGQGRPGKGGPKAQRGGNNRREKRGIVDKCKGRFDGGTSTGWVRNLIQFGKETST